MKVHKQLTDDNVEQSGFQSTVRRGLPKSAGVYIRGKVEGQDVWVMWTQALAEL